MLSKRAKDGWLNLENVRCTQPDYSCGIFLWGNVGRAWQGSQRSDLSERACTLLNLRRHGEHTLSIATFGSLAGRTRTCPIVTVNLNLNGHPLISLEQYANANHLWATWGTNLSQLTAMLKHIKTSRQMVTGWLCWHMLPVTWLLSSLKGSDYYWQLVSGQVAPLVKNRVLRCLSKTSKRWQVLWCFCFWLWSHQALQHYQKDNKSRHFKSTILWLSCDSQTWRDCIIWLYH